MYPSDVAPPGYQSAISFRPPKTRANNAIVYLSRRPPCSLFSTIPSVPVDFILDVNGYFQ